MSMPSDKVIEAYIKNEALADGRALSADEITEAIAMIKAEMTEEQISNLTRNTAEPTKLHQKLNN